ncbi:conserved hypothetical protein [Ricinus communis]|uniref:Uncharacterized protein n=1 Tax=Ricinus communis TaxID=3988 RepID=B9SLW5_RICCO|nr:conserved hypothetical protein [Ricinus communis]|eukprot:XP_002526984.1 uncharacterized protein LOC8260368 [Ricinus communis]
MEIPVINRIGDFEASLQNPSFLSQAITLSGVEKIHQAYGFWKWGALILALVASFSTIINRIKNLIIRIQNHYLTPSPPPPLTTQQHYDSDTESETSSSSSSDDEQDIEVEDDEEDEDERCSWRSNDDDDYYSVVKGSGHYIDDQWQNRNLRRRRNSSLQDLFSEFRNGKSVVKLWDNLGFGFGLNLDNNSRNCVSLHDINKELSLFSILGERSDIPAVSTSSSSPAVIVSSEANVAGNLLKVWDTRVGCRIPEILAEWRPRLGKFVGISSGGGGVGKVYVRDDVTGRLTVGDMRKVKSPLVNATETDVDTWWDADGVSVGEEDNGVGSSPDSVLLRG